VSLIRRQFLQIAVAAALTATSPIASTQFNYPARPVRLIVTFPPGGAADIFARLAAQKLTERLGQQFYVENIAGAGGTTGTGQAARAAPDGYTLLLAFGSFVVSPSLFAKVPYDPKSDFEPVTLAVAITTVLTVNPSVPAKNVEQLIHLIRANPGKYNFAHPGLGTQPHLSGEQFRLSLALDLVPVPFSGAGPAIVSILGGHTPIGFSTLAAAAPNVKDGKLRALAVTSKTRSQALPDVPTMAEAGHPNISGDSWIGVLVPAGTPKDIITFLHREFVQIIGRSDTKESWVTRGYEPVASTPEDFADRIRVEIETWRKVIQAANIKVQ